MIKLLVANADIDENLMLCKFLTNENDFEIQNTQDAITTLNTYFEIQPDIFVLDSNFNSMIYTEIIDKISLKPDEKKKCNTILTLDRADKEIVLENTAKIYKILHKPIILEKLLETINLMKTELYVSELTINEINTLLLYLNFNTSSKCTKYMAEAILYCFYHPSSLLSLNNVINIIAMQFNVEPTVIKEGFRCSLARLNRYGPISKMINKEPILNLLTYEQSISPKFFLDIVVTYLINKKNKR